MPALLAELLNLGFSGECCSACVGPHATQQGGVVAARGCGICGSPESGYTTGRGPVPVWKELMAATTAPPASVGESALV